MYMYRYMYIECVYMYNVQSVHVHVYIMIDSKTKENTLLSIYDNIHVHVVPKAMYMCSAVLQGI